MLFFISFIFLLNVNLSFSIQLNITNKRYVDSYDKKLIYEVYNYENTSIINCNIDDMNMYDVKSISIVDDITNQHNIQYFQLNYILYKLYIKHDYLIIYKLSHNLTCERNVLTTFYGILQLPNNCKLIINKVNPNDNYSYLVNQNNIYLIFNY